MHILSLIALAIAIVLVLSALIYMWRRIWIEDFI